MGFLQRLVDAQSLEQEAFRWRGGLRLARLSPTASPRPNSIRNGR